MFKSDAYRTHYLTRPQIYDFVGESIRGTPCMGTASTNILLKGENVNTAVPLTLASIKMGKKLKIES
ncbi:MAG TPA: hypothetical protein DDW76_30900 [Cyanobacteria bacterium UBA11369]|nr:hypothetical protein [Cyanobacteria bacterium UBA11371]HBE33213.1 hypothetical protein [Cyanobacteria bacterium UBA11368]HBE53054.1 hypothetical protein [Cyanobacteria bacterium UBA11369]